MNDYTVRDRKYYDNTDIATVCLSESFSKSWKWCVSSSTALITVRSVREAISNEQRRLRGPVNFILAPAREEEESFVKEALLVRQALSLCASLVSEELRFEAAFSEAVPVLLVRLTNAGDGKKISLPEMNARINALFETNIKGRGYQPFFGYVSSPCSTRSFSRRSRR